MTITQRRGRAGDGRLAHVQIPPVGGRQAVHVGGNGGQVYLIGGQIDLTPFFRECVERLFHANKRRAFRQLGPGAEVHQEIAQKFSLQPGSQPLGPPGAGCHWLLVSQ